MDYVLLSKADRDQIVRGFIVSAEADHFRASLNLLNAQANKNEQQVEEWTRIMDVAANNIEAMKQEATKLNVTITSPDAAPDDTTDTPPSPPSQSTPQATVSVQP